jgi:hypothetical protein
MREHVAELPAGGNAGGPSLHGGILREGQCEINGAWWMFVSRESRRF